jgi:hypothetical protein
MKLKRRCSSLLQSFTQSGQPKIQDVQQVWWDKGTIGYRGQIRSKYCECQIVFTFQGTRVNILLHKIQMVSLWCLKLQHVGTSLLSVRVPRFYFIEMETVVAFWFLVLLFERISNWEVSLLSIPRDGNLEIAQVTASEWSSDTAGLEFWKQRLGLLRETQ